MNRSKLFLSLIAVLFVAGSTFAATVTVGPTGQFPTLNAALEAIDYNDGSPDVLLLEAGATFDEQLAPKGNAGADSTAFPRATGMSVAGFRAAVGSHTDPLVFRSADPNNPAVITKTTAAPAPSFYGMFPADPGDSFIAQIVACGRDITFDGVDIRYGLGDYGLNGMGSEYVFQDCLFSFGLTAGNAGENFAEWNNNWENTTAFDPLIGLDNTYTWDGCLFEGASLVDSTPFPNEITYFHGFGNGVATANVASWTWNNCVVRNWEGEMCQTRGNGTGGSLGATITDCFFSQLVGTGRWVHARGNQGPTTILRNVGSLVKKQLLSTEDRDGTLAPQINVANNLLVGGSNVFSLRNNGGVTPQTINIVNNTFYNYTTAILSGANGVEGNTSPILNIANNIFAGHPVAATDTAINGVNFGPITANLTNNGFFNNLADLTGVAPDTNVGAVTSDPAFAADASGGFPAVGGPTDVNIPAAPLSGSDFADRVGRQNFIPTGAAYINGGNGASYNSATYGNVDVDSLNARIGGASIDIGAQESDGVSVVASWDMY